MKSCPQCSSMRVSRSHAHTLGESLIRYGVGYHYYRCRACGWRGMGKPHKKQHEVKPSLLKTLLIYASFVLVGLVGVIIFIQNNS